MAADYPTSVKSFATKVDNVDLVMAADINDIQTEVAAIETQLITSKLATLTTAPAASKVLTTDESGNPTWGGAWLDWTPTLNTGDADLSGYDLARYCKIGKLVFVLFSASNKTISGSSGLIEIGLPVAAKYQGINLVARVYPVGGTYAMVQCRTLTASQVMTVAKSLFTGQWTGDETGVYVQVEGFYEAA